MHHTPSITFEPTFVIAHVVGFGDVLSLSVGAEKGPVMGASKGTESVRCATGTSEGGFHRWILLSSIESPKGLGGNL